MDTTSRPSRARGWLAVHAALVSVILGASGGAAPRPWTLASPSTVVREADGSPDAVERLASLGYEVWHYGPAWVRIGYGADAVVGWWNPDGRLHVRYPEQGATAAPHPLPVAVGDREAGPLATWGTPTGYLADRTRGVAFLRYRGATVIVGLADGRVREVVGAPPTGTDPRRAAPAEGEPREVDGPVQLRARATLARDVAPGGNPLRAGIHVEVTNAGPGTAHGLVLRGVVPGGRIAGDSGAATLGPGATVTMRARAEFRDVPADSAWRATLRVEEAGRFDLDPPLEVVIPARAVLAPRFVVRNVVVRDQSGNGRIEPREIVDLVVHVANEGAGEARGFTVRPLAREGLHLVPGSETVAAPDVLAPGATVDVRFSAYTDSRATTFAAAVAVQDARPGTADTLAVTLPLDRRVATAAPAASLAPVEAAPAAGVADLDATVPRARVRGNTVVVALGVERYERAPAAQFARRDATAFGAYAAAVFGTAGDPLRQAVTVDDGVTRAELHRLFDPGGWLSRRVDAGTDVIVYFAGHGIADPKTRRAYVLPFDADPAYPAQTGLALDELYDALGGLGARSVTVFVDACFSGLTRDGASLLPTSRDIAISVEHPALRYPGLAVFTAAEPDQRAEGWPAAAHGVFTYWLLAGIAGRADRDNDGAVNLGELDAYLRAEVPRTAAALRREQRPTFAARDRTRVLVGPP